MLENIIFIENSSPLLCEFTGTKFLSAQLQIIPPNYQLSPQLATKLSSNNKLSPQLQIIPPITNYLPNYKLSPELQIIP